MHNIDVAIIGGGPAGLQAALVLARTRKAVVVFDAPSPPRNDASHGVHNFLGLDGLVPQEIRDVAWSQIDVYESAELVRQMVNTIERASTGDLIVATTDDSWQAKHVILTCGYCDVLPEIEGFASCWANTIIPCPFCDGFENRDRIWGIVPSMDMELDAFPQMVRNWTDRRVVIAPRALGVSAAHRTMLLGIDVPLHEGDIVKIEHTDGKIDHVTLDSGEIVHVGTLLWTPPEEPAPLITNLVESLGLAMDEYGYVVADESQRTNIDRLWAAGDVQGWTGAIESANAGGMAATMLVHGWFENAA
ncbi:MAG: thioredoxin reductase [Verrucomicrobiales bacterium]|jgi:thioredoxin reductase